MTDLKSLSDDELRKRFALASTNEEQVQRYLGQLLRELASRGFG